MDLMPPKRENPVSKAKEVAPYFGAGLAVGILLTLFVVWQLMSNSYLGVNKLNGNEFQIVLTNALSYPVQMRYVVDGTQSLNVSAPERVTGGMAPGDSRSYTLNITVTEDTKGKYSTIVRAFWLNGTNWVQIAERPITVEK